MSEPTEPTQQTSTFSTTQVQTPPPEVNQGVPPTNTPPVQTTPNAVDYDTFQTLLPEEYRSMELFQNISKENPIQDMAKQLFNANKLIGVDKMPLPNDKWGEEEWGKLYDRLGRPADGKYELPDAFKAEGVNMDAVKGFSELAHKAGLNQNQFHQVMEFYAQYEASALQSHQTQLEESAKQALLPLKEEWGDNFNHNLMIADKGIEAAEVEGLADVFERNPHLKTDPAMIKLFHKIALDSAEATASRTGDSTNPFAVKSQQDALVKLDAFEEKHRDILTKLATTQEEKVRQDEVIKQRTQLYKIAYPNG